MNDAVTKIPENFQEINIESSKINFSMPSDLFTGSLLRTLVASKPNGYFLELGTGTGLALSWIVEGMDKNSNVISIDIDEAYLSIARQFYSADSRVSILCEDANNWIKNNQERRFDLIFADAMPGKYESLEETLNLLKKGGIYIIDDMLPQLNWPKGHEERVNNLLDHLDSRSDIQLTKMNWSTGVIIITKIN